MKYFINLFIKIEYLENLGKITLYGKKLQNFFNLAVDTRGNKVNIFVKEIKNILFVKPTFTKGYFEIQYTKNNKDRWFQTKLSKSFWYGAEEIFNKLKKI